MTEAEAKARCAELATSHPDRKKSNWIPVEQKDGTWAVARIPLPPPVTLDQTGESRRDPGPQEGEDLRKKPWLHP
jgi:hypothetical protein